MLREDSNYMQSRFNFFREQSSRNEIVALKTQKIQCYIADSGLSSSLCMCSVVTDSDVWYQGPRW